MRSLFLTQNVAAVGLALDSAEAVGRMAVVDWPRLGRQLADHRDVVHVSAKLRSLRKHEGLRVYARAGALPFADGSIGAVVCPGLGAEPAWETTLAELSRVVRDGGAVVLVDRVAPTEMTRRALCAGLAEIEQRQAGRTVVTSGRVFKLVSRAA